MRDIGDTSGFPPGKAEELVLAAYHKYITASPEVSVRAPPAIPVSPGKTQHTGFSTWNGCSTDKYCWSQSKSEVSVEIILPVKVHSTADVSVTLTHTAVSIILKSSGSLLEGQFPEAIDVSESSWVLEDKKRIVLSLEKKVPGWWKSFLKGDKEIDTSKVDSTVRMDELSAESQSAVQKILIGQNSKVTGFS